MPISATEPIDAAWRRMTQVLFKPFSLGKWFTLGFCAFLAQCGSGGGGGGGGGNLSSAGGNNFNFSMGNLDLVLIFVVVAVAAFLGLLLLLVAIWLGSRGQFMFMDGIAKNRGAVKEPWGAYRRHGASLFRLRLLVGALFLLGMILVGGLCFLLALPSIQAQRFGAGAAAAIVVGVVLLLPLSVAGGLAGFVIRQFIQPLMYVRNSDWRLAWGVFRREVLAPHGLGPLALFWLMRVLLVAGAFGIATAATCLTCCLTALPYIGTVLMLPILVFLRAYTMCWLQQFGEGFRFFPEEAPLEPAGGVPTDPGEIVPMR